MKMAMDMFMRAAQAMADHSQMRIQAQCERMQALSRCSDPVSAMLVEGAFWRNAAEDYTNAAIAMTGAVAEPPKLEAAPAVEDAIAPVSRAPRSTRAEAA